MGRRIAKLLGEQNEFRYFSPGIYIGKYQNYDFTLKYDNASLIYNIDLSVKGKANIDNLNKLLAKIDLYAIARYKNNNLVITESCDTLKDMPKLANIVIKEIATNLEKNKYQNICHNCSEVAPTNLYDIDGNVAYLCHNCYQLYQNKYQAQLKENKKIKEHIFLGIIGSILGSIPGVIIFFILDYLKLNSSLAALIIMLGSAYGYKWFANSMKLSGLILSLLIGFSAIILANEFSNAYNLYTQFSNIYNINIYDAYKSIPYYFSNSQSFKNSYIESLIIAVVFGLFGSLSNFGLYRKYIVSNKIKKLEVKNVK